MSETSAVTTFLSHVKKLGNAAHHQRFEDKYQPGIPDLNVVWNGVETWVEAKFLADWPKRPGTGVRVPIRKEQVVWARMGALAGRRVRCVLRVGSGLWVVWDASKVDFAGLVDGTATREEVLAVATWSGRVMDVTKVLGG